MTLSKPRLTVRNAAAYAKKTDATLRRWAAEGKLPFWKIGRAILFRQEDLDAFLTRASEDPNELDLVGVASELGASLRVVRNLVHAGSIEARRVGGKFVVSRDELDRYIESTYTPAKRA